MEIESKKLDPNFKYEVADQPGGDGIKACFACGVCTAGCPVTEVDERYNPRKLIRMVLLGMKEEVLSSDLLWYCSQCYTCYAHCPQNVKFTDVVGVLRNMAIKEGYFTQDFAKSIRRIDGLSQLVRCDMVHHAVEQSRDDKKHKEKRKKKE